MYTETADSTMSLVRSRFPDHGKIAELRSPVVAVAGFQRLGRGRSSGRSWVSGPDESLLFTFTLEREQFSLPPQVLPLVTGLGVARYLENDLGLESAIKWPNDVLVSERKICGILCESTKDGYLVGIGLNLWQGAFDPVLEQRRFPPVSLLQACGINVPANEERAKVNRKMLMCLLGHLAGAYRDPGWQQHIRQRLYGRGRPVRFRAGTAEGGNTEIGTVSGILHGITDDGGLLIDTSLWYAGEIESVG